jgi:purine catabolism regulator
LSGTPVDPESLNSQAAELGYQLDQPHVALVIAPTDGEPPALLQSSLDRLLLQRKLVAPVLLREDSVLVFVPVAESPTSPHMLLDALRQNHAVTAGVSSMAPTAGQWARALDEAEQALALGRQLFGENNDTAFADLGVYRLLLALRESPELWRFYRDTLGPLLDHGPSSADLLETLEGYFLARGNVSRAAALLHIHRNTLIYRLQRICEIANIDWERSEDQLALQLALKVHRVLRMVETNAART